MSQPLYPTGHCFDDALDFLEQLAAKGAPGTWLEAHCTLVHGICLIPPGHGLTPDDQADRPFAHAWVEVDNHVVQAGLLQRGDDPVRDRIWYALSTEDFQAHLRPGLQWRYTIREAWDENERSGTFGPWRPELLALCKPKAGRGG